jgi:hypothetical protein
MVDTMERSTARKRVMARRGFQAHLTVYAVVNAALVGIWLVTGGGYFWPGWVLFGWGIGLLLHALTFVGPLREITDEDVDRELTRMGKDAH